MTDVRPRGPVLLLTHSGDYYTIDLVQDALERRGVASCRINTDQFPAELKLSVEVGSDGFRALLVTADEAIELTTVPAVWARRLWPGRLPPNFDSQFAQYCHRESRTAFFDTFALLSKARWINPLAAAQAAESKLRQLRLAAESGLHIPHTVIGNDADRIRRLFQQSGGKMVTKLLCALSQTMDASGDFVYTSQVTDADMAAIGEVRYAPQIFQPLIEKARELRVIVVGDRTFVGAIDASQTERGQVDWRRLTQNDDVHWTAASLPAQVETVMRRLLDRLGLVYAAVDFIVDKKGRHIFLEVNPSGEWGWLQKDLGFPIAEAIADALVSDDKAV